MRNLIGRGLALLLGVASAVIPVSASADDFCRTIKGPDVGDYELGVSECDGDGIVDQVALRKLNGAGFLYEQVPPGSEGWEAVIKRDKADPYFTFAVYKIKKNGKVVFTDRVISVYHYQQLWDSRNGR